MIRQADENAKSAPCPAPTLSETELASRVSIDSSIIAQNDLQNKRTDLLVYLTGECCWPPEQLARAEVTTEMLYHIVGGWAVLLAALGGDKAKLPPTEIIPPWAFLVVCQILQEPRASYRNAVAVRVIREMIGTDLAPGYGPAEWIRFSIKMNAAHTVRRFPSSRSHAAQKWLNAVRPLLVVTGIIFQEPS